MKKLFYVRHGETVTNVEGIFAGITESALTKKGKVQAKKAGEDLSSRIPNIDLIVSSPLSRAHDTASIIALEIGYPAAKIIKNELFMERAYGKLEGTSGIDYSSEHSFEDIDKVEGAETIPQVHERAIRALEYLESLPQDNILVVSHGTFGRALIRVAKKLPHTHEYDPKHREEFRIGNAEIVEII